MVLEFLSGLFAPKCNHENISLDKDFGYCPDCGALVENQWYLVRCSCCGMKHKAIVKNGKIVPIEHFCHNCGTQEYSIERLKKIDFVNINYAALLRVEIESTSKQKVTQCWVDSTEKYNEQPKLLQLYQ